MFIGLYTKAGKSNCDTANKQEVHKSQRITLSKKRISYPGKQCVLQDTLAVREQPGTGGHYSSHGQS